MASQTQSPGTIVNEARYWNLVWTNPSNAAASDDARTYAGAGGGSSETDYLKATNFGFTIPTGATIDGILVEIEGYNNSGIGNLSSMAQIIKGGVYGGTQSGLVPQSEAYGNYGSSIYLWGTTWTAADINASNFGIGFYALTGSYLCYVDHVRITVYYTPVVEKTLSDLVASVTESISVEKTTYDYTPASNVKGYILNMKTGGWTYTDNLPFVNAIYRPTTQEIWGARRDKGQLSKINSGSTFDGTPIASIMQTGFMDFGELDEKPVMEAKYAEALKRLSAFFSEVKSEGNLTLTIYTENDATGKTFTITPATVDNTVYNQVRTALSRSIRGKYVSFKITNASGQDFWVGACKVKIYPRSIK